MIVWPFDALTVGPLSDAGFDVDGDVGAADAVVAVLPAEGAEADDPFFPAPDEWEGGSPRHALACSAVLADAGARFAPPRQPEACACT